MGLLDRIFGTKTAKVPFVSPNALTFTDPAWGRYYDNEWHPTTYDTSWGGLVNDVYSINSAVAMCILRLAQGFPEAPPLVKINNEVRPDHPLMALLMKPNPLMSHAELMQISIVYRAVGGNVYLHKIRGMGGEVKELWPYHQGQMWPVPSQYGWVEEYEYKTSNGQKRRIPSSEIIHLKWPLPDLAAPYQAMSPLAFILREVMTDTEATVFTHSLLNNNAMPSGVITLPEGTAMSPQKAQQLREKWHEQHGGTNRGGVVILEHGASYARSSMSPVEIDLAPLRNIPEARIAGNLGVPPIVAGLNVGLERSTFSNYGEAVKQMTEGTFVPQWRMDANELTQALQGEFPGAPVVAYDTSKVAALQESTDAKFLRATAAFEKNGMVLDEFRASIDLPPIDQVIQGDARGKFFSYELRAPLPQQMPQPNIVDVTPKPAQITDGKGFTGETEMLETKATEVLETE